MKADVLEYKFLALLNKEDEYYQNILSYIVRNNAVIVEKNDLDTGIEFTLNFSDKDDLSAFRKDAYPKERIEITFAEQE